MDIQKWIEELDEQVSVSQASIHNFRRRMKWMRNQMEGLIASVHQLVSHVRYDLREIGSI